MAEPTADTRTNAAHAEISRAEASTVVCGGVKDKLKNFERMKRNGGVEHADGAALMRPRAQRISNAVSLRVSEKKVRELESALRHREELIRSLEGIIAQRESDLSFVLKEKFHLSKTIVASRSAAQPCNVTTLLGVQRLSSADAVADSVGHGSAAYSAPIGSSHTLVTLPRSHSQHDACCEEALCEEAVQSGLDDKVVQESRTCRAMSKFGFEDSSQTHRPVDTEVIASGAEEDDLSSRKGTQLRPLQDANSAARGLEVEGSFSGEKRAFSVSTIACRAEWDGRSEDTRGGCPLALEDDLGSAGSTALLADTSIKRAFSGRTRTSLEDATVYLNNRWRLKADKCDEAALPPIQHPSPVHRGGHEEKRSVGQNFYSTATEAVKFSESGVELEEEVSKLTQESRRDVKAADPANTSNSLRVQTQARIDAEAETLDVLAMHEELCSKIDCFQNAFEEICQELDAVRNENRVLVQNASTDRPHTSTPEFSVSPANPQFQGQISFLWSSTTQKEANSMSTIPERLSMTDTMKPHEHGSEKSQTTLERIEKLLRETAVHRCHNEGHGCRSDAEFLAIQKELKETQRQLGIMEQRCRILQDIDNRPVFFEVFIFMYYYLEGRHLILICMCSSDVAHAGNLNSGEWRAKRSLNAIREPASSEFGTECRNLTPLQQLFQKGVFYKLCCPLSGHEQDNDTVPGRCRVD
ncbi:hypothetical protein Esti_003389 [Eimeria stiedai]